MTSNMKKNYESEFEKSVALKNVHKRLLHKYGFPYGLSLESLKGKGTTVSVKIPVKVS